MTSGLRRFLAPAPEKAPEPRGDLGEQCEMCAEPIGGEHSHVVNIETRAIQCTCRGCYLLFTHTGAASGKRRAVPDRFHYTPAMILAETLWESAGIPVGMAFFFVNSELDKTVAFYPGPAGATESLLPLGAWQELLADNPAFADIAADVEALLIKRHDDHFECYLVPIDVCYQLVGLIKLRWRGFDGGTEAHEEIDRFFSDLRQRAKAVGQAND